MKKKKDKSTIEKHEELLITKVINILETDPYFFSARWFSGDNLDTSVQSKNKKIQIMIDTGQIINPIEPKMTTIQKNKIKELIRPIVEKDSIDIINELLK
jgi:hypothetical protein